MAGKRTTRYGLVALMLVAGLGLSLWSGLTGAQEEDAQVRIVHAGYGIGAADVYIEGDLAIEALQYSDATEYLALPAGEYDIQVTPAGGDPAEAMVDTVLVLDGGTPHTVVAVGPAEQADIVVIIDDHTPPVAGMAKLSLVNATSDGIAVSLALDDGTALIEDVPFADASEYLELDSGVYDFAILAADSGEETASISGFSSEPGTTYSVFAVGVEGDYQAVAFVDALSSGSDPAATPTEAASAPTPAADESTSATAAETPAPASATPTAEVTATPTTVVTQPPVTPTVMPTLPDTGGGGASESGGLTGALLMVAAVVALAGAAIWLFGHMLPRGRS